MIKKLISKIEMYHVFMAIFITIVGAVVILIFAIVTNPNSYVPDREHGRLVTALDSLCADHQRVVLYVGDTTVIDGRFLECGTDFGVLVGTQAPEKLAQRYWVPYGSVKMVREVQTDAQ